MKTTLMAAAILATGGFLLAQDKPQGADSKPTAKPEAKAVAVGDAVDPATKLRDLDGVEKSFADLKGKVVVLAFYSIECPWMKPATPKLKALAKGWEGTDVAFFAVDANKGEIGPDPYAGGAKPKETYSRLRAHMKEKEVAYTICADHGNKLADLLGAQSTPHCFVFDKTGVLRYAGALDDDGRDEKGDKATRYLKDAVDAVLKGEKPKVETTKPYGCTIKRESAKAKS